jgi:glucose/mannose transport system substrate-binding protein
MRRQSAFTIATLLATTLVGCGSGGSSGGSTPTNLEFYSWLTSGSEKMALDNLLGVLRNRYPSIHAVNEAPGEDSSLEFKQRMADGKPPDSFQALTGTDLLRWGDVLGPLDLMANAQGWYAAVPKGVLDSVSLNGAIVGVPLGIERENTLFYNKAVLAAHGVSVPTTVAEFFDVAAALKSQGVTPLSVSDAGGWTIGIHLFDSLLVAEAGPDFVESYYAGKQTPDAPEIQTALGDVARMMDYANDDRVTTGWGDAVQNVCAGTAAMTILGDFARGQFAADGCGPDVIDYVTMEPAGSPTFVFVGLGFAFPKNPPHPDAAAAFVEVTGSVEGQRVFNTAKGMIPSRTDVPLQDFDLISQKTMQEFAMPGERHVLDYAAATSSAFQSAVNTALQQFVDPASPAFKDVGVVLTVLRLSYAKIVP